MQRLFYLRASDQQLAQTQPLRLLTEATKHESGSPYQAQPRSLWLSIPGHRPWKAGKEDGQSSSNGSGAGDVGEGAGVPRLSLRGLPLLRLSGHRPREEPGLQSRGGVRGWRREQVKGFRSQGRQFRLPGPSNSIPPLPMSTPHGHTCSHTFTRTPTAPTLTPTHRAVRALDPP